MAETFGAGLASGLNGLLSSLRNDRERKAQEDFKLKLIEDDKKSNQEISERVRKQRALEVFGKGLSEIQGNKINMALSQLQGNAIKHAKSTSKPLDQYQKQYEKMVNNVENLTEKLASYLDRADAKEAGDVQGLLALEGTIKDPSKRADFTNTKNLLQDYINKRDQLGQILEGGLAEQQNLQSDVEGRAEKLRQFNIDDALNTREARVLQLSLGLTDDDVATFRQGGKPSGTSFEEVLGIPFQSRIGVPSKEDFTFTTKPKGIEDNPAKRSLLKYKLEKAITNLATDITSLSDLSSQDFSDARSDPELSSLLESGLVKVKSIGGNVKQQTINGAVDDATIKTFNNILKLGGKLTPEQLDKIRKTQGDDGATATITMLSDLGTPDIISGLSRLNEKENINYAQKGFEDKITSLDQLMSKKSGFYTGANPEYMKKSLTERQKLGQKKVDSIKNIYTGLNSFKQTLIDPNYQFKYTPINFDE